MVLTFPANLAELVKQKTHRFATLWKIEPQTGTALTFTDFDQPIVFDDGDGPRTYTPAGGFDASARELQSGLREQNLDVRGVLTDDAITYDDLRAHKYDAADVTEFLVDHRFPHGGAFRTRTYRVGSTKQTAEVWVAELNGLTNRLQSNVGRVFARPCDADLFDARCTVDENGTSPGKGSFPGSLPYKVEDVRVLASSQDATEPRRIFDAVSSDLTSTQDEWWKYGKLVWSGAGAANADAGVVSEVKSFVNSTRTIELYEPTPFDIQDNDTFTIFAGCDKLKGTCRDKFDNTISHRGQPYMPSTDKVLRVRRRK